MEQIILKLGFYFLALILAYVLKLAGIFKKEDSSTVMALVMNVCLPATAICAFADLEREFSMLIIVVLGFVMGFAPWFLAALTSRKMVGLPCPFCSWFFLVLLSRVFACLTSATPFPPIFSPSQLPPGCCR